MRVKGKKGQAGRLPTSHREENLESGRKRKWGFVKLDLKSGTIVSEVSGEEMRFPEESATGRNNDLPQGVKRVGEGYQRQKETRPYKKHDSGGEIQLVKKQTTTVIGAGFREERG